MLVIDKVLYINNNKLHISKQQHGFKTHLLSNISTLIFQKTDEDRSHNVVGWSTVRECDY